MEGVNRVLYSVVSTSIPPSVLESEEVVLTRTRGTPDEHRLRGERVLGF